MKKLKVLFLLFAAALCSPIQAQDMFDESLRELEKLNNITYDYVASFLEYPSNHENTIKVFRGLQDLSKFYDEQYNKRFELLSRFDNYKTREYVNQIEKSKYLIDALDETNLTFVIGISSSVTLTTQVDFTPFELLAVITAVPFLTPVTLPLLSTVTSPPLLDQVRV